MMDGRAEVIAALGRAESELTLAADLFGGELTKQERIDLQVLAGAMMLVGEDMTSRKGRQT